VAAARVVPALNIGEQREARFGLGLEAASIDELAPRLVKKLSAIALS
jgi:hypothetical protein